MDVTAVRASAKNLNGIATRLGKTADSIASGQVTEKDHATIGVVRSLQKQADNRLAQTAGSSVGDFSRLLDDSLATVRRGVEEAGTQLKGGMFSTFDLRHPRRADGLETVRAAKRDALDGARALESWADRVERRSSLLTGKQGSLSNAIGIRDGYRSDLANPALSDFDRALLKQDLATVETYIAKATPFSSAAIEMVEESGASAANLRLANEQALRPATGGRSLPTGPNLVAAADATPQPAQAAAASGSSRRGLVGSIKDAIVRTVTAPPTETFTRSAEYAKHALQRPFS